MDCGTLYTQKNEKSNEVDADRINCDCHIQCVPVLINQYDEITLKNTQQKNVLINTTHELNEKITKQAKKLFEQTCQVDQDHLYGPNRIIEIQCSWNV